MGDDKNISIVQLQKPKWASQTAGDAEAPSSNVDNRTEVLSRDQATGQAATMPQPVNMGSGTAPQSSAGSNTAAGGDEGGVNNEGAPVNPKNRQEAVTDHFTPKPKPTAENIEESTPDFGNYQDIIDFLEERKAAIHLPSKEDLARERRRKRTDSIISSLADGASAISNLIFTTKYAPDMYDPASSMGRKTRERYERLKKEHEADEDRYYNYAMTIAKLKEGQEAKEYQRGRDALKDTLAQLKADRDADMADLKMELLAGKISEQDAAARAKEIEADYADDYWNARVDEVESRKRKNDRYQPSRGRGGGGGKGHKPYGTFLGETYYSKADYDMAVEDAGRSYGVGNNKVVTSGNGIKENTRQVKKTIPEKAAEITRIAARSTDTSTQRKAAGEDQKPKKKTNVKWK